DIYATVLFFHQPSPARTKVTRGCGVKGCFELFKAAPLVVDGLSQRTAGLATCVRCQAIPVKGVVRYLGCVVKSIARGRYSDFLALGMFVLYSLYQAVKGIDIGLVVLAVVVLESLF